MEGEHTPTIIQFIQSMDLVVIQLKDSHIFFIFSTNFSLTITASMNGQKGMMKKRYIIMND